MDKAFSYKVVEAYTGDELEEEVGRHTPYGYRPAGPPIYDAGRGVLVQALTREVAWPLSSPR